MDAIINRFFNKNDEQIKIMDNFTIPLEWWSRTFEYKFASEFLNKNDVVIDAGCGINHPFKDFASNRVKKVFAIDSDIEVLNFKDTNNLCHLNLDLRNLSNDFEKNSIDKIFCISVLEHAKPQIPYILEQFKNILKDEGKIILTLDYPTILCSEIIEIAHSVGLMIYGNCNFELSNENIVSSVYNLRCFRLVLEKNIIKDGLGNKNNIKDISKLKKKDKKGGL